MYNYQDFFKRFGIRLAEHLTAPKLTKIDLLELPRNAVLHYLGGHNEEGPDSNDYLFHRINRPILVEHITSLTSLEGNPRKLPVQVESLIKRYHLHNKRFKRLYDIRKENNPSTLVIVNYARLNSLYRYTKTLTSNYNKWLNVNKTFWDTIAKTVENTDRDNYIFCELPDILPSFNDLNTASISKLNSKTMKVFNTHEKRVLLQLWGWMGSLEQKSHSTMSNLPIGKLSKINLIFVESGKWTIINLGLIHSWRQSSKEEIEKNKEDKSYPINPHGLIYKDLQKRFLRMMSIIISKLRSNEEDINLVEENKENKEHISKEVPKDTNTSVTGSEEHLLDTTNSPKLMTPTSIISGIKSTVTQTKYHDDHTDSQMALATDTGASLMEKLKDVNDDELEQELEQLNRISERAAKYTHESEEAIDLHETGVNPSLEEGLLKELDEYAATGRLSAVEYNRHVKLSQVYTKIPSPDGKTTLSEFIKVPKETLVLHDSKSIEDIKTVFDKSMLKSTLHEFDSKYVGHVMDKDIAAAALNIQHAGVSVTSYDVEKVSSITGDYTIHSMQVVPVEGKPSTLTFRLPVVNPDGVFVANGVKYRLRKQIGDLPIRKVSYNSVALTSYYGKTFVQRSTKKVNSYIDWLANKITMMALGDEKLISDLNPAPVYTNEKVLPKIYSDLSRHFTSFTYNNYQINFNHEHQYPEVAIKTYQRDGRILFGMEISKQTTDQTKYLTMDTENNIYECSKGLSIKIGDIETFLKIEPTAHKPVEFAELRVLGKTIPIGIILGHEIGFTKLINSLGINYREVEQGTRANLQPNEYSIVFEDFTYVFDRKDTLASLILAGFNEYKDMTKIYSMYEFDKPNVYLNLLDSKKISSRYMKEVKLMYQLFIDPITREILEDRHEPTTFRGLLMMACELLKTNDHPDEVDPLFMRKKGYERFAGTVYGELVKAIRVQKSRIDKSRAPIDLNPHVVWTTLSQDPSKILVNDINPIENLKQTEAVTFSGHGGRDSRSMVKRTRGYHKHDVGVISEATVDSSSVSINTYTSADPKFTSLRGTVSKHDVKDLSPTNLFSTSALLAPCADRDDGKRVNFINIQNSHTVACKGYKPAMVRTGYEQVLGHRTGDLFCTTAKQDGVVTSLSETGIIVEYKDGTKQGIELGIRFGKASGLVIPHNLKTDLKIGQKFKSGDAIAYNSDYFTPDPYNKNNVVYKAGFNVNVVLLESSKTLDDSSAISDRVANLLETSITHVRSIVIGFKDNVHNLVKVGTEVESEDTLCIIEDPVNAQSGAFDEETINTLKLLSNQAPSAKFTGRVDKIEIFYYGEKEDMSESLKAIVDKTDKELSARHKSIGRDKVTGKVDAGFRLEGDPLQLDSLVIQVYINSIVGANVGDKFVFANQLKTVACDRFSDGTYVTENGVNIDGCFGIQSIYNRIVNSPMLIGTTNTLLEVIAKKAVNIYRNG